LSWIRIGGSPCEQGSNEIITYHLTVGAMLAWRKGLAR
jgi:hypothetical protein